MSNKPEAYLSINKNRLKQYHSDRCDHAVYLNDGDEFEIELNNPTSDTYLAKFQLNGKSISNTGIVLRPGEHTYIRRYLDEDRKFRFETYEIPKSNSDAVQDNGLVTVKFYKEKELDYPPFKWDRWSPPYDYDKPYIWHGDTGNPSWTYYSSNTSSVSGDDFVGGATLSTSTDESTARAMRNISENVQNSDQVETGRVEQGGRSGQQFTNVNKDFKTFCSHTTKIKIRPHSQKPRHKNDTRIYCTNCGARFRENWKFCAHCGEKRP